MAKLLTSFLKISLLLLISGCTPERKWYKKEFTASEKPTYAKNLRNGVSYYYQGTVAEQFHIKEALALDTNAGYLWREFGTARVKRGIADEMQYYYGKAVEKEPDPWAGFRGYLYLYFYRDYARAISDFNYSDKVTASIGYSQGQNHDYMRGIAYYGSKDYEAANFYLSRYIDTTIAETGEEWVDAFAVLYRALAYEKLGKLPESRAEFARVLRIYEDLADVYYHLARLDVMEGKKDIAFKNLQKAKKNYQDGYYHSRPYVEVLEQIYWQDLVMLEAEIENR
jgi:tetratricopeptide (TPR) repeat protein